MDFSEKSTQKLNEMELIEWERLHPELADSYRLMREELKDFEGKLMSSMQQHYKIRFELALFEMRTKTLVREIDHLMKKIERNQ